MKRKDSVPRDEEDFEELIAHVPEEVREQHRLEILENAQSLKDEPLEIRKKEADREIHLARYE